MTESLSRRWCVVQSQRRKRYDPMSYQYFGTVRHTTSSSYSTRPVTMRTKGHAAATAASFKRQSVVQVDSDDASMSNATSESDYNQQSAAPSDSNAQTRGTRSSNVIHQQHNQPATFHRNYRFTDLVVRDSEPIVYNMQQSEMLNFDKHLANLGADDTGDDTDHSAHSKDDTNHSEQDQEQEEFVDMDDDCESAPDSNVDQDDIQMFNAMEMASAGGVDDLDINRFYQVIGEDDERADLEAQKEMDDYEHTGMNLTVDERKQAFPGWKQIDEIKKWQRAERFLIPKDDFFRFVGAIIMSDERCLKDIKLQESAMLNLQCAAEDFISQLFEHANSLAINSDRQEVNHEDIQLAVRLWLGAKGGYDILYLDDTEDYT